MPEPEPLRETAQAEQLIELLLTALQSHARLESIEQEFETRLADYWAMVSLNVEHGIELARLKWANDAKAYDRTNKHLERECNSQHLKTARALARLEKAGMQIAKLKEQNNALRQKRKAKAKGRARG